jgi:hypothetical protein
VIVIAHDGEHRRVELADDIRQIVEIHLAVADEVAANDYDVRLARVGHRNRVVLDLHGRDPADVQVGQVRDPYPFEMLEKALGACEATNAKPARSIVPRVALT